MRTRRLDKKIHKYWLQYIIDASQKPYWREKLFEAKDNIEFPIDSSNCNELFPETVAALKKYNLRFFVARVPSSEAEPWLSEDGMVIFKFWSQEYPEVKLFSGNNPDII